MTAADHVSARCLHAKPPLERHRLRKGRGRGEFPQTLQINSLSFKNNS